MISENSRRIARNTLMLYFRMLLMTLIGLFTSRVVIGALGVEDYGVYNAVGGAVALFTFLSTSMSSSLGRYLAVELETGDAERLRRVFSVGVLVQVVFSLVLVVLVETLGMWLLTHYMVIPPDRMWAARIVLHCSLASMVVDLFAIPYNAAIIAHEKMSAFALVGIADALLKLAIAVLLMLAPPDRLCLYAVLMLLRSFAVRLLYGLYCRRHFAECRGRLVWDSGLFRQIAGFSTWNTVGSSAAVFNTQGANVVANLFFGVAVNAARGVATQLEALARQFVSNFLVALNPRITKSWSAGERDYCFELVRKGMKFAYLGIFVVFIPVLFEAESLLDLWLVEVPGHAADFVRLALVALMVDLSCNSALTLLLAVGKIRVYYIITGTISYLCLPLVWLAFRLGASPEWAYVCFIAVYLAVNAVRLLTLRHQTGFSLGMLFRRVLLPLAAVSAISLVAALAMHLSLSEGVLRIVMVCMAGWAVLAVGTYFLVLTEGERTYVDSKLFHSGRNSADSGSGMPGQEDVPEIESSPEIMSGSGIQKGELVVYTCIIGAYDRLRQPRVVAPEVDYVCFVGKGEKTADRIGVWQIRELDCGIQDSGMLSRYPKMHPHRLLPEYEASLWMDGNIEIMDSSIYSILRGKLRSGVKYSGVRHPSRDCVYQEAWMCRKMGYLSIAGWLRVCAFLMLHGQRRHAGLSENNLIFRRHNDPDIVELDELWWSMLSRLARRDQLSFQWCLDRCGVQRDYLFPEGLNIRNHPGFRYLRHK